MTISTAPKIFQSLANMQEEISVIGINKDKPAENNNGKTLYKYRGIDDVYNLMSQMFFKHNIVIGVNCLSKEREAVQMAHSIQYQTFVTVEYTFTSTLDGSTHKITMYGESFDYSDKGVAKAMSMAYKSACFQVFCIPVVEDPDKTVHDQMSANNYYQGKARANLTTTAIGSAPQKINQQQIDDLTRIMSITGQSIKELCQHYGVSAIQDLTVPMYDSTIPNMLSYMNSTKISEHQVNHLISEINKNGFNPNRLLQRHNVSSFKDLTLSIYSKVLKNMNKYLSENSKVNSSTSQAGYSNQTGNKNAEQYGANFRH